MSKRVHPAVAEMRARDAIERRQQYLANKEAHAELLEREKYLTDEIAFLKRLQSQNEDNSSWMIGVIVLAAVVLCFALLMAHRG